MEMSKRQAEFWVMILVLCIITAAVIMLVDFGIKAAILEESTRLRLAIEEQEVRRSGQKPSRTDASGVANDSPNHPPIPSDVLVVDSAGMEAGNVPNGATDSTTGPRKRRTQPRTQD
jgi:hypothetical protein